MRTNTRAVAATVLAIGGVTWATWAAASCGPFDMGLLLRYGAEEGWCERAVIRSSNPAVEGFRFDCEGEEAEGPLFRVGARIEEGG